MNEAEERLNKELTILRRAQDSLSVQIHTSARSLTEASRISTECKIRIQNIEISIQQLIHTERSQ